MLSFAELASGPGFAVTAVTCSDDHTRWSGEQPRDDVRVVLVRSGRFRRSCAGVSADLDATVGYVGLPGEQERFAHPAGGDMCTSVSLSPRLWRGLAEDTGQGCAASVYVDARVDLAHRRLLAAMRGGDVGFAGAEGLVRLVGAIAPQVGRARARAPLAARDRELVGAARALVTADHPASAGLIPLAELLAVSPYRLSRAFGRELGVSLTRYRNRVRVGRALDRIEGGERQLGVLAADLGFADQAHLCRTVRAHLGHTPTALRGLLASPGAG